VSRLERDDGFVDRINFKAPDTGGGGASCIVCETRTNFFFPLSLYFNYPVCESLSKLEIGYMTMTIHGLTHYFVRVHLKKGLIAFSVCGTTNYR